MKPSEQFIDMANDIERNATKFGGAIVIVPPMNGGDPVARLVVTDVSTDPTAAAVFFWNIVQAEIKARLDKLQDQERMGAAFGGRR